MNELDEFMVDSASEGAETAGEPILVGSQKVNAVFDEQQMTMQSLRYGDDEKISCLAVIAKSDLDAIPLQKSRVTRLKDNIVYFVDSVNEDGGHVELSLYREGKRNA